MKKELTIYDINNTVSDLLIVKDRCNGIILINTITLIVLSVLLFFIVTQTNISVIGFFIAVLTVVFALYNIFKIVIHIMLKTTINTTIRIMKKHASTILNNIKTQDDNIIR